MAFTFNRAFELVVGIEGGYVNDPKDPGGETKFGISKRSYPNLDIKNLTKDKAMEIYRLNYWNACKCDKMPAGIALLVFDHAINAGNSNAGLLLQQSLADPLRVNVSKDGVIGPKTIAATKSVNQELLLEEYAARRGLHYALLDNLDDRYGHGWMRRLARMYRLALKVNRGENI